MSEENHLLKKAWQLLWKDIRRIRIAIIAVGGYLLLKKTFLHSLCPCVVLTGFPCPGCGMTRAACAVLRGDFVNAWNLHPFVYVWIGFVVAFGIRRYILQKDGGGMQKYLIFILVGMFLFYIYRMIRFFPNEAPMTYYYDSFLYRLLGYGKVLSCE